MHTQKITSPNSVSGYHSAMKTAPKIYKISSYIKHDQIPPRGLNTNPSYNQAKDAKKIKFGHADHKMKPLYNNVDKKVGIISNYNNNKRSRSKSPERKSFGYANDNSITYGNGNQDHWLDVFGKPGKDFPAYHKVPNTGFSCSNFLYPGYYADQGSQCQVINHGNIQLF